MLHEQSPEDQCSLSKQHSFESSFFVHLDRLEMEICHWHTVTSQSQKLVQGD